MLGVMSKKKKAWGVEVDIELLEQFAEWADTVEGRTQTVLAAACIRLMMAMPPEMRAMAISGRYEEIRQWCDDAVARETAKRLGLHLPARPQPGQSKGHGAG